MLARLMDKGNKKLKKDHDEYCRKIKRRRNKGIKGLNDADAAIMAANPDAYQTPE